MFYVVSGPGWRRDFDDTDITTSSLVRIEVRVLPVACEIGITYGIGVGSILNIDGIAKYNEE